jgi:hypothetical protein
VQVFCTVALPLDVTLGAIHVWDLVDDLVHQHRFKHLSRVILGLELHLLVEIGVAVTQGAVGVCEGPVIVLAPMWPAFIPAGQQAQAAQHKSPVRITARWPQCPLHTATEAHHTRVCLSMVLHNQQPAQLRQLPTDSQSWHSCLAHHKYS